MATLTRTGAALAGCSPGMRVAVKVMHPGVASSMLLDMRLLEAAAAAASKLPMLCDLRLDESVRQFRVPLEEQLDLQLEGVNMAKFAVNFWQQRGVHFPRVVFYLASPQVLVESFEDGQLIAEYAHTGSPEGRQHVAQVGLRTYMKMLLRDNFIHADLHPGNMLVLEGPRKPSSMRQIGEGVLDAAARCVKEWVWYTFLPPRPEIVVLDTGMVTSLAARDQRYLVDFFLGLTRREGELVGRSIVNLSERGSCLDERGFVESVAGLFRGKSAEDMRRNTDALIADMFAKLREFRVTLKREVSVVVVSTMVLEGWACKLDPNVRIIPEIQKMLGWGLCSAGSLRWSLPSELQHVAA